MSNATQAKAAAEPGAALRAIRQGKGWTLLQISQRTGMPVSTLSKIENGKLSVTYDKLARISAGLEIDIARLFAPSEPDDAKPTTTGRRSITRAGEGRVIDTHNYGHSYPAADLLNKRFVPVVADIHARSLDEFGEMIRHPGEEYAYVLEGEIELHTSIYAPVRLKKGDSIYFDSDTAHAYIAVGDGPAKLLSICSGPESQIMALFDPPEADASPAPAPPVAPRRQAANKRRR